MSTGKCDIEDCEKPRDGRLCQMHRTRLRRHGSTDPKRFSWGPVGERYERYVIRNAGECWGWRASFNEWGYAKLGRLYAHRVSWELHRGAIPPGALVLHRCDNPPCSNPDHLFLGSHADNMADASVKGRLEGRPNRPRGEGVKSSKLTAEKVRQVRQLLAEGQTRRAVAERFGVHTDTIHLLANGRTWRHV